jgi:hypothetical protein
VKIKALGENALDCLLKKYTRRNKDND